MQGFRKGWIYVAGLLLVGMMGFGSCKKETKVIENVVYDNVIYDLDTLNLYTSNVDKTKQKSSAQYISILYADLFNRTISTKVLNDLDELKLSLGDKTLANELLLNSFVNETNVAVPAGTEMRDDVDAFIDETYIRFYLRKPTEYERHYLKELIMNDPGMTPELIYTAFAVSEEYQFY